MPAADVLKLGSRLTATLHALRPQVPSFLLNSPALGHLIRAPDLRPQMPPLLTPLAMQEVAKQSASGYSEKMTSASMHRAALQDFRIFLRRT